MYLKNTKKKNPIEFYSKFSNKDFPALREIMMKIVTVFSSTHVNKEFPE